MNEQETLDAMGGMLTQMVQEMMLNAVQYGAGFLRFSMQDGFSVVQPEDYQQLGDKIVNDKDTAGQ